MDPRDLLRTADLRATTPRLALLAVLIEADGPLDQAELLVRLDDGTDRVTLYRNLKRLCDAGLVHSVTLERGTCYELVAGPHAHPHFVCTDCGAVQCLPDDAVVIAAASGRWAASVRTATLQLQGHCPDCLGASP